MIPIPNRLSLKLIVGIGCVLLLALLIHDRNRWKAKTEHYAGLLAAERASHKATVANYRGAAERARRQDAENVARVKAEQGAINERTRDDFESRIAAARARAGRMRSEADAAPADPGRSRTAPMSAVSAPAGGAAQAAGQDRLPRSDRLVATEQAIQLDELIKWVRAQRKVDPNAD